MTPLFKILPQAKGSDVIRKCWGTIPVFDGYCEVLHLAHLAVSPGIAEVVVTALFVTEESENLSECKPSKIRIRFSGVTHCEYDNGRPEKNDIKLADVFTQPPPGIVVSDFGGFHVAYRAIQILSCVHDPFTPVDDVA